MNRKNTSNLSLNNNNELLNQPLHNQLNIIKKERTSTRRCVIGVWLISNITTFILGYLLKSQFTVEHVWQKTDGSL